MSTSEKPGAIRIPFLRWWKSALILVLVIVLIVLTMLLAEQRNLTVRNDKHIALAGAELTKWSEKISAGLKDEIAITSKLHGFVYGAMREPYPNAVVDKGNKNYTTNNRTQTLPRFEEFAESLHKPWIFSLQLQPTGVIWQVFPKGSAPIPLDLLDRAPSSTEIYSMVRDGQLNVVGPVRLIQSGVAMIMRSPVYTNASNKAYATWWGNVAVLVMLDTFLTRSVGLWDEVDGVQVPFVLLNADETEVVTNSSNWERSMLDGKVLSSTIQLTNATSFVLKVMVDEEMLTKTNYGTAFFIAILSGLALASAANIAYLCTTHKKPVVVLAPKTAPFFIVMIDIVNIRKWWREYPEEMIFIVESIDAIIDSVCAKHGCYKTEPTLRRVFCVAARRYEDAYECALDILIEVSEMAVGDIMQIEMLGNSLPVRATIHHCTDAFVHHDPSINKYIYTGHDMKLAEEMHSLCNQYTLQLSDAAKQYADPTKCHFLLVTGKHRKWSEPVNLWCALPGGGAPGAESLQEDMGGHDGGFDVPHIIGPSESSATMGDAGRRDVAIIGADESQRDEQPIPLLRSQDQESLSTNSVSATAPPGRLLGSGNSVSQNHNQLNVGGSIVGLLAGSQGGHGSIHRRSSISEVSIAQSVSQQQVGSQQIGSTAISSILVKILRDAGEVRLLAPDAVAIPKLFFEAYRILFLGFRAAERNNIFQRLRSSFGLPMNNTMEHLAVRAAIMYVEEEEEARQDGDPDQSMERDDTGSQTSVSGPFSPTGSMSEIRRSHNTTNNNTFGGNSVSYH